MNEYGWVSIVAMLGWLVLAVSAVQSYRLGARKIITMTLAWMAIFAAATAVFAAVGR